MFAYLECRFDEVFADLLSAVRRFQTVFQVDPSASPAAVAERARAVNRVVAQCLADGVLPPLRGLSPAESALYRAALRYGSARSEREQAALQVLIDLALALPPAAHPTLTR